jgi:class 3 adenylate cyclase/tetratricopeptide (TPR) repeat protein
MLTCPKCGQESPEGFKHCGMCGAPLAAEAEQPREERKVVTVLFADLVGFTARAEQLDPEDVRALLAPYHARLRDELERHGGTVEKFIGDAIMALFGAPLVHEDDPERAVRAAIAIRDWVRSEEQLHVRIAVNTGEALIRIGAATAEGEGMASGDVVNTAARLQAAAPVNGILAGETTYRATNHAIQYQNAELVEAKGKSQPIPVWEVGEPRARFGVDLLREVKTALVGREPEVRSLEDALARARSQRAVQLLTLVGEPGIGKSRLVYELMQVVESRPELIRWRQGRSLPYGEGGSFWALSEMVKAEAAILESDSPDQVVKKLHAVIQAVMPDEGEAGWVEGHLQTLVGVGEEAELVAERRKEAFAAWRRFLEALAHERPLVLVFEDLHSADDSMLDFVDHLVDWASGVPILVLATARPELFERRPGWGGGKPNVTTLAVAPLTDEETQRLIAALLQRPLLPATTQSDLLARAGGNPLYAEQYVRMLAEHGSAEQLPLPETVQGLIAARLDLLSGDEKRLIQDASVVGKVFWSGAVGAIAEAEPAQTEELLHALQRKEFVQRAQDSSVAGETEYAFRHLLVRDVAYGQIPRAARAEKHRAAATWIESLARSDDHAETLAHHYSRALELARAVGQDNEDLVARARVALQSAGDRAYLLGAASAAQQHYGEAIELWPEGSAEWARLVVRLRRPTRVRFERDPNLVRARDVLLAEGDLESGAEAELYLGWDAWNEWQGEETAAHLGRALEVVDELPASHTKAYLLANVAIQLMLAGELDRARAAAAASLEIADELELDDIRVHAQNTTGMVLALRRDPAGIELLEQSLESALAQNHAENVVRGYKNLGSMLFEAGRLERLPKLYAAARAAAERFGDVFNLRWFVVENALHDYLAGDWDEALQTVNAFIAEVEAGATHYMESAARTERAKILLARGELEAALADSTKAYDFGRSSREPQVLVPALAAHVRVLFAAGKVRQAEEIAEELLGAMTTDVGDTSAIRDAAPVIRKLGHGRAFLARLDELERPSQWEVAARAVLSGNLAQAIQIYRELGARPNEAEALLVAAKEADQRDPARREYAAQALEFFRSVGAAPSIRETEELLGIPAAEAGSR